MTNVREDTHIVRPALQNRVSTSRNISEKIGVIVVLQISARMVRRILQQRGLKTQ